MITHRYLQHFRAHGFVVVEALVPESLLAPVRTMIAEVLELDPADRTSWYRRTRQGHGCVPIHHHQALWDVRQFAPLHRAFAAVHGKEALWVSADRASFKPPVSGWSAVRHDPIHWDADPEVAAGLSLQGLVYLSDTTAEQGAFCCVPSLYRELPAYLQAHPGIGGGLVPELEGHEVLPVPGPSGSLILWDKRLPHSSLPNFADVPRWVQYVAMDPVGGEIERRERIRRFELRLPPDWAIADASCGPPVPEPEEPARLTSLGRRLVGLDTW